MNKRLNINVCETFNPSRWRCVPVRHGYLLVRLLTFLVAFLIKPASIFVTFWLRWQMSSPWWWRLPDRPGDHHHLPPIWSVRLRLAFVVFGVSFKPWLLLWITWCYCVIPLTGRKEPCDVKPVASACLNRYQTPISSMITNLKQQKNWGETLKVWKKHNKIWIERSESSSPRINGLVQQRDFFSFFFL